MESITFEFRDEFSRKVIAENISTLFRSNANISPFMLDGSWGTGKTEFTYKLINLLLESEDFSVVYIDAFRSDHVNEPLLSIIAEVIKLVPEEHEQRRKISQKVLPALKFGLKTSLKAGVSHLLRQETESVIEDFEKEVKDLSDALIDSTVENLLESHVKAEENMEALRQVITGLSNEKPIVLFIDELDRCRPNFAISMLETIKHVFDMESVKVCLVTNSKQLEASVRHCYGFEVDAQKYLDKFIKYRLTLPTITQSSHYSPSEGKSISFVYYRKLLSESEILKDTCLVNGEYSNQLYSLVERAVSSQNVSLREIEGLVRHIEVLHILNNDFLSRNKLFGYSMLYLIAILLSVFKPETANKVLDASITAEEMGSLFGVKGMPNLSGEYWERPEHYETFTVMIAQQCHDADSYQPPEEAKKTWDELKNAMFRAGWGAPDDFLRVLCDVIRKMQLHL